jgi:hypothetical protein
MIRVPEYVAKFGSEDKGKLLTKVERLAMEVETDHKIAAAINGEAVGFFHFGKTEATTSFPAPASEADTAFDFETNTPYRAVPDGEGGFIWDALPALDWQDGVKIDVMEMLDGAGVVGGSLAGKWAAGLFSGGAWQFIARRDSVLIPPPADGKLYAMKNGAWEEIRVDY